VSCFLQHIINCGALIYELVRHADFSASQTRAQAAALIYLILRRNFQERGNVTRAKLQLTIATERMVNLIIKDTVSPSSVFNSSLSPLPALKYEVMLEIKTTTDSSHTLLTGAPCGPLT